MPLHHLALARTQRHAPTPVRTSAIKAVPSRKTSPTTTYVICTNPRSGSWLLSEGLASTAVAGNPREWFNISEEQLHRARWRMEHTTDLSSAAYLELALRESTTRNGISGIKLHYYQFAEWPERVAAIDGLRGLTSAELMRRLFPNAKYIWLTRRDKVRQAISFVLASRTNEWWDIAGEATHRASPRPDDLVFDAQRIERMAHVLEDCDARWQSYFEDRGITPMVIQYEDLVADYAHTVTGVLKWLGIPDADAIAVPAPRLRRQSNARNEDWLARYTAFKSEGGHPAPPPISPGAGEPDPMRTPMPLETIPNAWKRWVGQGKLLKTRDEAIVEVLTNNGYARASAAAEVEKAGSDQYLLGATHAHRRLRKGASLLNALGEMARLESGITQVDVRATPSRSEFRDRYYAANRPVVLQGLMSDWRAMTAWTPQYLKHIAGDKTIEVMTGRDSDPKYERNGAKHRTNMRFADYIDLVHSGKITNDYYLVPNNRFFQNAGMAPLLHDFAAFPAYLNPANTARQTFLWFGPAGTVTPLHHDTSNILMAQVIGRKRYRLIPPTQWQSVYNSEGVYSDVDCETPDFNRYPRFRDARMIDVVVAPGEVLFVPVGWWHHVRALDVSMTVSFTNFVFPNHFNWEP